MFVDSTNGDLILCFLRTGPKNTTTNSVQTGWPYSFEMRSLLHYFVWLFFLLCTAALSPNVALYFAEASFYYFILILHTLNGLVILYTLHGYWLYFRFVDNALK